MIFFNYKTYGNIFQMLCALPCIVLMILLVFHVYISSQSLLLTCMSLCLELVVFVLRV